MYASTVVGLSTSTFASLSTAVGTLVLAVATFSSVRSSQRSARVAERSLLLGLRPILAPSHLSDPPEKVRFGDRKFVKVNGGMAAVEQENGNIYMVIPLRNLGAGMAVLHSWYLDAIPPWEDNQGRLGEFEHADTAGYRRLSRDLYVPAGDVGFWQGAIRDQQDVFRPAAETAIAGADGFFIDLLYGDEEGGQRTISRFNVSPHAFTDDADHTVWTVGVVRHWRLDGFNPRD